MGHRWDSADHKEPRLKKKKKRKDSERQGKITYLTIYS